MLLWDRDVILQILLKGGILTTPHWRPEISIVLPYAYVQNPPKKLLQLLHMLHLKLWLSIAVSRRSLSRTPQTA